MPPRICPRSCSSLATAAVFVSVGVVQIFAGFILLQSKYVYLLAGPDIWTAFSNFSVGAALGISSRIWKNLKKTSAKHMLKRNLLAALMVSAIIINTTTTTLLILGENNALLAIYLETNGRYHSVTLASELLAYAYASSVCSPVICLLAAVIHLSANCFQVRSEAKAKNVVRNKKRKINEDVPYSYNWVFGREEKSLEGDCTSFLTASFSESSTSSDDSFGEENASIDIPLQTSAEMENFKSSDEVFQRQISYSDFIMIEKCSLPIHILQLNSNHPNMNAKTTCTFATHSDKRKHLVCALAENKTRQKQPDKTNELTEKLNVKECLEVKETHKAERSSASDESLDLDDSALGDTSSDVSQTPFWAGEIIPVTVNSPFSAQSLNLITSANPPASSNANDYTTFKEELDFLTKNEAYFITDSTGEKYERKSVNFSTFVGNKNKDVSTQNHLQVDSEVQSFDEKVKSSYLALKEVNVGQMAVSSHKNSILKERTDFATSNEKPLYSKEWPSMEFDACMKGNTYSRKNHIRKLWSNAIADRRSSSDSNLDDDALTDVLERELVTKLFHDTMFRKVLEKRLIEKKVSNFDENSQMCAGGKNFINEVE